MYFFSNFQYGGRHCLGFSKIRNFNGRPAETICAAMQNFVKIDPTVVKKSRYNFFSKWRRFAILDMLDAYLDHPRSAVGGIYRCAKFDWN